MTRNLIFHRKPGGRAGAYIIVLGSALLVSVIGLSALLAQRIEMRALSADTDSIQARLNARAALEMGLLLTSMHADWRTSYGNGLWLDDQPLGSGSFSLAASDPEDGDVTDSPEDPVVLTGTGYQGDARHNVQITLTATTEPLSCLEVPLLSAGTLHLNGCSIKSSSPLASNSAINAWYADVYADVEAVDAVTGSTYHGSTDVAEPRTMPDDGVFDYYLANGTYIDVYSLYYDGFQRWIYGDLLSPASNPYGDTNAEGIYVIDCQNQHVAIGYSRIVGTLVLLNPGSATQLFEYLTMEPAVENFPVLLVNGNMTFDVQGAVWAESWFGVSFNPPGTPYDGEEDNDTDDEYPTVVKGLVYVSGWLDSYNSPLVEGVLLVGGATWIQDQFKVEYGGKYLADPPPGFVGQSRLFIVPQSWRQVVD